MGRIMGKSLEMTARRIQVLRLLCQGCMNKHIAARLHMSERAVKLCRQQISVIAGAKTPVQLGVWAVRNGYADQVALSDSSQRKSAAGAVVSMLEKHQ